MQTTLKNNIYKEQLTHPLTISIWIASYPGEGSTIDDIIRKSEETNYLAKSLDKNRVIKWTV